MKVYFFGVPQLQKIWSSIKIVEAIGSGFPLYLLFHCIAQKDAASILNALEKDNLGIYFFLLLFKI